jgi:hypothetical protein
MSEWSLAAIIVAGVAAAIVLEQLTAWVWPPTGVLNCF